MGGRQSIYDSDLDRNAANHVPLTPVDFLTRAAAIWPRRAAPWARGS